MTDEAGVLSLDVKLTHGLYGYTENIVLVLLSVRACPAECEVARICVTFTCTHSNRLECSGAADVPVVGWSLTCLSQH